jgi:hypothetical protein
MNRLNSYDDHQDPLKALLIERVSNPKEDFKEFIQFRVMRDGVHLHDYLFYDNTYGDDKHGLSNVHRHMFRFPKYDYELKKGMCVRVYTRDRAYKGNVTLDQKSKDTCLAFFWGMGKDIWNNDGDKATLLYVKDVDRESVQPNE